MTLGNTIVFKTLSGGYEVKAMGTVINDFNEWVEVTNIQIIASKYGAKYCSHRVATSDILKHYKRVVSLQKVKEEHPEFFY